MKILLKIIDCLNPISIFKSIKKYIENRAKIEAKLIDKEKQRQHEKDLQDSRFKHESLENEKDRKLQKELAEEKTKRLGLILENKLIINRQNYYLKHDNNPKLELELKRKRIKVKNKVILYLQKYEVKIDIITLLKVILRSFDNGFKYQ